MDEAQYSTTVLYEACTYWQVEYLSGRRMPWADQILNFISFLFLYCHVL